MALHLTNHLFVLIGSISSICPVISNSILKTVKRRLCPLSTMFPHAPRHLLWRPRAQWDVYRDSLTKIGHVPESSIFQDFSGIILWHRAPNNAVLQGKSPKWPLDSYGLIPKKIGSYLLTPVKWWGGIYWIFFGGESGLRVRQSALFDPLKTPGEMTWNDMKAMPLMTTTFTGRGFVQTSRVPHGTLTALWRWQCQVNSNQYWWEQNIALTSWHPRFFVQLLLCNSWSLTLQSIVFPWEIKTLERKFCPWRWKTATETRQTHQTPNIFSEFFFWYIYIYIYKPARQSYT